MNSAKNYTVQILNDQYVIESDDPEEFVLSAIHRINTQMRDVCKQVDIDTKRACLLVALRLASQLVRVEYDLMQVHQMEAHLVSLMDDVY